MKIVCDCLDTETYDSTTSGGSSGGESSSSSSSDSSSGDSSSSSSSGNSNSSSQSSSSDSTISDPYIKSITSNTTANNETQLTITTSTGTNVITIPSTTITNFSASKTAVGHKLSLALNNTTAKTVSLTYDASLVSVSSNIPLIKNCQYLNQALDVLAKNASSGNSTKITSFEITSGNLNTDKIYETIPKATTLTLSWSIYNTPQKVLLFYGDEEIDVTDYTTADITISATTAGIIDITLACFTTDNNFKNVLLDSKTLSIQVGDPYYYGFSAVAPSSSSTAAFIKTLTKHLQLTPETGPLVLDCKNNSTKYWSFVSPYKVYILNAGCIVTGLTEHTVNLFLTDTNNGYDNMYIYTFPYKFNNNIAVEIIKA